MSSLRRCSIPAIAVVFSLLGLRAATIFDPAMALTGQVSSTEEGRMEGVLVSAKRAGSTITITVVSESYRLWPASVA
ncbi:MAG TPA: hypothetical protein VHY84_10185 [Bryobacteraceae bacterium]|nr:hypothetical protein [Bryobacteraceae bacterium]